MFFKINPARTALAVVVFTALLSSCLTPSILVTREQNSGDASFNNHNYREAITHYNKMLESSAKLGIYRNMSAESEVCRKIASASELLGDYSSAMVFIKKAAAIDSVSKNSAGLIEDYIRQGSLWVYMGSYFNGISSLEKALSLSEGMDQSLKNTKRLSIASAYLSLGQLYTVMGRGSEAESYISKAYNIYRQAADRRGEMEALLSSGMIKADRGDIINAGKDATESLRLANELKVGTARQNQLLATLASAMGEYENAVRYQSKALEDAERTGIVAQIIWSAIGMGDIYTDLGDSKRAGMFYQRAALVRDTMKSKAGSLDASLGLRTGNIEAAGRYFSSEGSLSGKGISYLRMAGSMADKGEADSAIAYLSTATAAFKSSGNRQGLANAKLLEGRMNALLGRYGPAQVKLDSALAVTQFPETVWQALYQKGVIHETLGENDAAVTTYSKAIEVIEKMRGNLTVDEFKSTFFDSKRKVYDRLINLLMERNEQVSAFRLSEQARARAFYDILANKKIDYKGSVPGDLISLEQEKRLEMQKLYKLLQQGESSVSGNPATRGTELKLIRENLTKIQEEYEELLRRIKLNNPSYAEMVSADPVDPVKLQPQLGNGTALLEYWLSDSKLVIWLVTAGRITGKTIPVGSNELTRLVEKSRIAIKSNSKSEYTDHLSRLYSLLIQPFGEELKNMTNLVIIPNGTLHFLPFQALVSPSGKYLVEDYSILYAPSASVYLLTASRPLKKGSMFMGFALTDLVIDNKPGLPGTRDELGKIVTLFPGNINYMGLAGRESLIKLNAPQCDIIHFATHGSYNYRQPLYSYLLFPPDESDDGHLNVFEVLEMNLNAKLVTLSACETGLGNLSSGDELTGLSRAFLFAGSSSVIVSLWAVADYPTSLLMTKFYSYLGEYPVQEALTLAQRDVIKVFPHPQYWSPFILIGNGNVTAE